MSNNPFLRPALAALSEYAPMPGRDDRIAIHVLDHESCPDAPRGYVRAGEQSHGTRGTVVHFEPVSRPCDLLATMRGGVEYNHRMSMWVAHAPSGAVYENGSPGLLHAFEDTVEDAIANVFAKWREAGAPAWPRGAVCS